MESFFSSSQKVIVIEIFKPQFKLLDGFRETKLWSYFVTSVLETRGVVSVIATISVVVNVIYHLFHFIFLSSVLFSRNSALDVSFIVKLCLK